MKQKVCSIKQPCNEPVLSYVPGSAERELLTKELERIANEKIEIPLIIGGQKIETGDVSEVVMPHDHKHRLAVFHRAGEKEVNLAIEAALDTRSAWENAPWIERVAITLRAAELISVKYRYILNAATMLNQGKNVHQAEIDATCELADFLRFNPYYMNVIYGEQPLSDRSTLNRMEFRPLEGFVFVLSPFNFTSLTANLSTTPAVMGNVVVWKPSSTAVLSGYYLMQLFKEAGFPDGVINFIPGSGAKIARTVLKNPHLAGIHFTGSTEVFRDIWKQIGENISLYRTYPRIVGETGGKNFVFAHSSAGVKELSTAMVRGAFEYQGQKCSAASRAYIPRKMWPEVKFLLGEMTGEITVGDPRDFKHFMNAVIDENSFDKIMDYIEKAEKSPAAEIVYGGKGNKSTGYFIEPTIILTRDPHFITMEEEIFGPVLTVFLYEEEDFEKTLHLCNETSPYALTGSIFAKNREAIVNAMQILTHAAGNFYINDKPTGAMVGHQPFGGSRASGTNDKAGSHINLHRWTSPRTIKENLAPPVDFKYPFMVSPRGEKT
jgi:1-pyrroline-5-carboxylate dehydrogenase